MTTTSRQPQDFDRAYQALCERYRASIPGTISAFQTLADQLSADPVSSQFVGQLRYALHRVHGGAGSFGFPKAGALAATMERRVIVWATDPLLDAYDRGQIIRSFTADLAQAFEADFKR